MVKPSFKVCRCCGAKASLRQRICRSCGVPAIFDRPTSEQFAASEAENARLARIEAKLLGLPA